MDLLKTDRTYVSRLNAMCALERAANACGVDLKALRFVVAVNDAGRFAPVVVNPPASVMLTLVHAGVTVVG